MGNQRFTYSRFWHQRDALPSGLSSMEAYLPQMTADEESRWLMEEAEGEVG